MFYSHQHAASGQWGWRFEFARYAVEKEKTKRKKKRLSATGGECFRRVRRDRPRVRIGSPGTLKSDRNRCCMRANVCAPTPFSSSCRWPTVHVFLGYGGGVHRTVAAQNTVCACERVDVRLSGYFFFFFSFFASRFRTNRSARACTPCVERRNKYK